MSPLAPAVIVFEKSPKWEADLKRRLDVRKLLMRPCRSAADVVNLCRQSPGSVVVIDLESVGVEGWRLLGDLAERRLSVVPVAISPRESEELEWMARELGAVDFVSDTIGGAALAELCRRATAASTATPPGVPARG
jgi:DNA-binding NtrC family response regulator